MSDKFSFSIAVQAKTLLVGRVCQMSQFSVRDWCTLPIARGVTH